MKKLIFIFVLLFVVSCGGDYIDKPKNLVPKDKMAEIMVDLAINDQATYLYPNSNLEAGTRYVLKTHNVKPKDFVESFRYYVVKEKMNGIAEDAQKILLEKDPKADQYVKDKLKKNGNIPTFAR
ncbi:MULTISPECIES: DUF4296 domain-containing protein [Chryseobacterium]|jgi:hypothetical protein|uniref:DUF4296 domain-containing protein n=1 Tax=Chryseobacterium geocarposphaerae TaxID=1416776 RepID=A0ABU1LFE0_9FLAO|nr:MULTISPECIES: DUF4296 domain-containing protein [Chryseobacterium]ALR32629.1 hypothetical protein ATE47_15930 [Chryseobacterium sp. IHB B 17019]MDR6405431.1 hypothetical protein [Chryseobacterium geocarposphaerae]MDR6697590.1 hypothetical protein [Chryseobacterium ginsenosidimutans]